MNQRRRKAAAKGGGHPRSPQQAVDALLDGAPVFFSPVFHHPLRKWVAWIIVAARLFADSPRVTLNEGVAALSTRSQAFQARRRW
jgi:hypothetical protein